MISYTDKELIDAGLYHAVHNSETKSYRGCRRRWDWVFREGYYPKTTPKALEFGIAFHEALQVWYDPEMWHHPEHNDVAGALALAKFAKVVKEQLKEYVKLNGSPTDEVKNDYNERRDLGLKMMKHYTTKISSVMDVGITPLAVEIPFTVPLGFKCKCNRCWRKYTSSTLGDTEYGKIGFSSVGEWNKAWEGLPVVFGGRIDMIVQDINDRLWIWDHKTAGRILDEDGESTFLQVEDQIARYCAALHVLGRPVAGFVYSEIKKAVPEEPQMLTRRLKGKAFSVSKNGNTDLETFMGVVSQYDSDALASGAYDEYINWLKSDGPKYFQRYQIHKNENEIRETWENLILEAQEMTDNPRIYPQPGRFSCNSCAFITPCIGKNQGEDYMYALDSLFVRKNVHYYEEQAVKDS